MDKYRYNLALQEENRIATGNLNHKPSLYGWIKELIEGYCADLRESLGESDGCI